MADDTQRSASTPWFSTTPDGGGSGQTLTTQRSALNQQIQGIANDLKSQNATLITAINAIAAAINALPSHA